MNVVAHDFPRRLSHYKTRHVLRAAYFDRGSDSYFSVEKTILSAMFSSRGAYGIVKKYLDETHTGHQQSVS